MKRIAVALARVSTEGQGKDDTISLPEQIRFIKSYTEKNNITLPEEYIFQERYSGLAVNRPTMERVKKVLVLPDVTDFIVYTADRYTRSVAFGIMFDRWLSEHNVTLHYSDRGIVDIISPAGKLMNTVHRGFAEYEADKIKERTQIMKRAYIESGVPAVQGLPPFGYRRVGRKANAYLEIVESEAEIVRFIYDTYLQTKHMENTARIVNSKYKGIRAATWNAHSILRVLRKEAYTGKLRAEKTRDKNKVDTSKYIDIPVIIPRETWEKVQAIINDHEQLKVKPKRFYLLRGKVYCTCGKKCTPFKAGKSNITYYRCNSVYAYTADVNPCKNTMCVPTEKIDRAVLDWLYWAKENIPAIQDSIEESKQQNKLALALAMQEENIKQISVEEYGKKIKNLAATIAMVDDEDTRTILVSEMNTYIKIRKDLEKQTVLIPSDVEIEQESLLTVIQHTDFSQFDLDELSQFLDILKIRVYILGSTSMQIRWFQYIENILL